MKRRLFIAGLGVAALVATVLLATWPGRAEAKSSASSSSKISAPSAVPAPLFVQTVTMQSASFSEVINATGTLRAQESVELQAETSGKVTAIHFQEGAPVRRGELLLKINDADLQASRLRAAARERLAEQRERRFALLLREGGANQQDYEAAASELEVQRAEVQLIAAQIAKTEVRAPFDGVIGLRFVSEGSFVSSASRIATLQHVETMKVDFSIAEKYATRVLPGQPVTFSVAGDTVTYPGTVYAIEPRIDELTRTLLLRANTSNTDGRLRPGAFANIELRLTEDSDALLVPAAAVIPGLVNKNVFVIEDGKAARRVVQTGVRTETSVQIVDGLLAGDVVITSGLQALRPGLAVKARSLAH